jgi:hypothetical protein
LDHESTNAQARKRDEQHASRKTLNASHTALSFSGASTAARLMTQTAVDLQTGILSADDRQIRDDAVTCAMPCSVPKSHEATSTSVMHSKCNTIQHFAQMNAMIRKSWR